MSTDLIDGIFSGLQVTQVGFSTIGIIATIMLLRGKIVTLREHLETRADRDTWRESSLSKDEVIATQAAQIAESMKTAQLTHAVMQAVDQVIEKKAGAE